ncbi:MAG: DNA mismatch repair protein MutS [Ruminococcus sp.]|nr:DNA mismatch repair protein MutS [Ruminococcus sp.]
MKHQNIAGARPIVDLLYPSEEKKHLMTERGIQLEKLPDDYISNLEIASLSELLCPRNQYFCQRLLTELCDDEEIIKYRQDALQDFLSVKKLMPILYKTINEMLTNDRTNIHNIESVQSFTALNGQVSALDCYISCIDRLHEFFEENKQEIKSEAVNKLFSHFEGIYSSEEYSFLKSCMDELHSALENRIRSVTVAINFDEEMLPVSAGIVGYSTKAVGVKPSVFDKLIYRGANFPDQTVKGKLFTKYIPEKGVTREVDLNETDKALFDELDKITDKYIRTLSEALASYRAIGFDEIYALETQLDFYDGAVRFIESAEARGIEMCRPEILPKGKRIFKAEGLFDIAFYKRITGIEHHKKGDDLIVRNDISFDDSSRFFILTGANNGGKTTFVRAIGICQVFCQAGLFAPAKSLSTSLCDYIYTNFPKEEEVGINSSRFTTEIKEFKQISKTITKDSLLLMNESIQSTTPKECVDIASELVKIFAIIGVRGIFATHLTDLAYMCEQINSDKDIRSKLKSIVMETDEQTGERKYKVKEGLPSAISFAKTVFEKYGIDENIIRENARRHEGD